MMLLASLVRAFRAAPLRKVARLTVVDDAIDDPDVSRFTEQLSRMLSSPVKINWAVYRKGKVTAQVETADPHHFANVLRLYLPFACITEVKWVRFGKAPYSNPQRYQERRKLSCCKSRSRNC